MTAAPPYERERERMVVGNSWQGGKGGSGGGYHGCGLVFLIIYLLFSFNYRAIEEMSFVSHPCAHDLIENLINKNFEFTRRRVHCPSQTNLNHVFICMHFLSFKI